MSQSESSLAYLAKAARALSGARILAENDDSEGACNRAYYAMFDAAHAALFAVAPDLPHASIKTHRGLISAFGTHLVQSGIIAAEFGASLNKVERLRLLADYTGDPVSMENASWAVTQAEAFIAVIRSTLFPLGQG